MLNFVIFFEGNNVMKLRIYYIFFIVFIALSGLWYLSVHDRLMQDRTYIYAGISPPEYEETEDESPYIININTADVYELCALDGIGEKKARAIVEYRQVHGGFKTIEELADIDGISIKTIEKFKDKITLEG